MSFLVKIFKKNLSAGKDINVCTSETKRTNTYFNYFLAGLIDGDGCLSISKKGHVSCEIVLHKKEKETLEWVQSEIGGSITQKTENSYRLRLHNKKVIRDLIERINGKLLTTEKSLKLKNLCELYKIQVIEVIDPDLLQNAWFSGFFDAEGSINYNTLKNQPNLSLSQKTKEILDICNK